MHMRTPRCSTRFLAALPGLPAPLLSPAPLPGPDPHLLRKSWFDPALASCLRGQLRYELLGLMAQQAGEGAPADSLAAAVADAAEYQEALAMEQARVRKGEPAE